MLFQILKLTYLIMKKMEQNCIWKKKTEVEVIASPKPVVQDVLVKQENTEESIEQKEVLTGNVINSPLVGTVYLAPEEGAKPFVQVGDTVKKGQVVAIVEAMKLMNEIESEFDGVVTKVLVENEQTVEYGQPLFEVE